MYNNIKQLEISTLNNICDSYNKAVNAGRNVHHENALAFKALSNNENKIPGRFTFIEIVYNLHIKRGLLYYDSPDGETLVSGSQMFTMLLNLYNYID